MFVDDVGTSDCEWMTPKRHSSDDDHDKEEEVEEVERKPRKRRRKYDLPSFEDGKFMH